LIGPLQRPADQRREEPMTRSWVQQPAEVLRHWRLVFALPLMANFGGVRAPSG
jgi:hypothetical protein